MNITGSPLSKLRSHPAITALTGGLVFASGIVIPKIRYAVPGPYHWTAARQAAACSQAAAIGGGHTSGCAHAYELLVLSGVLIVAGVALVSVAVASAVVRNRQRQAAILRHPASGQN
jgi:hypothetical protein